MKTKVFSRTCPKSKTFPPFLFLRLISHTCHQKEYHKLTGTHIMQASKHKLVDIKYFAPFCLRDRLHSLINIYYSLMSQIPDFFPTIM